MLNILQLDAARAALPRGKKKPLDVLKNIHEHVHGDGCHDAQCIFVQRPDLLRVGMLRDFHNQLTSAVARNAKSAEKKARVCMMLDFMIGTVTLKQHSGGVVRGRAQYAVVSQASSPPMPAPASPLPHVLLRLRRYPATDENMTFDELVAAASARACAAGSRPQGSMPSPPRERNGGRREGEPAGRVRVLGARASVVEGAERRARDERERERELAEAEKEERGRSRAWRLAQLLAAEREEKQRVVAAADRLAVEAAELAAEKAALKRAAAEQERVAAERERAAAKRHAAKLVGGGLGLGLGLGLVACSHKTFEPGRLFASR